MKDYRVTMRDSTGRTCDLFISADCIREAMERGASIDTAKEEVEGNAFANAIGRGEIGADAWLSYPGNYWEPVIGTDE